MAEREPDTVCPAHCFDTAVDDAESERFDTAVYIYLERRPRHVPHVGVLIRSSRGLSGERKRVSLWSAEAVQDFSQYWRGFRKVRGPLAY